MVATSAETPRQGFAGIAGGVAPVALALAVIVVVFFVAFFPSIAWMAGEWSSASGSLSHGYLVAGISAALFVRAVPEVAARPAKPAMWLIPILLGLSVAWLLAYTATVVAVQTLVLPAMLLAAIVTAFGMHAAKPLLFPVLYVYFALPAWEHLQFIFQAITVAVVGLLIRLADIPALIEGNAVELSVGTFEIAGGCSGLSFVVAGLSLSVLYAHLFYSHARPLILLTAAVLAVSMFGNWIRVFAIIAIGYVSDMQSGLVDDHLTFGWIIFAALMVPVFFFARRLESLPAKPSKRSSNAPQERPETTVLGPVTIAIATMLVGPVWAKTVAESTATSNASELQFPQGQGKWQGPTRSGWDWAPEFAGPAVERVAQYGRDDEIVLVYANYYPYQRQDSELVYFSNSVAGHWAREDREGGLPATVETATGEVYRQAQARNYAGSWIIWYRYQVGGHFEFSDIGAKVRQATEALAGRPQSGVIAFAARCVKSCDDATATLAAFAVDLGRSLHVEVQRKDDDAS